MSTVTSIRPGRAAQDGVAGDAGDDAAGIAGDARAVACPTCGLVHTAGAVEPGSAAYCVRCGTRLARAVPDSLARTAAFALAALLMYLPANLFPILRLELYGATSDSTVWDGVHTFYRDGDYFMAGVVFMASIFVPLLKLSGLFFLVVTTKLGTRRWRPFRTRLYRGIDTIGRWAMLDVFVLSIWVAVVKLGSLGHVTPGEGLLPFGLVVIFTLLASASFDPRLIWQPETDDA